MRRSGQFSGLVLVLERNRDFPERLMIAPVKGLMSERGELRPTNHEGERGWKLGMASLWILCRYSVLCYRGF